MNERDALTVLLADANLLPNERAAIERLLRTTVEHHPAELDAPTGALDSILPIVALGDNVPKS